MAGFTDLIRASQGALFRVPRARYVATATLEQAFRVVDSGRNPIDLTAATITCEVLNPATGAVVLDVNVEATPDGVLRLHLAAAEVPLTLATRRAGNTYPWRLTIQQDGKVVALWSATDSYVTFIHP